MVSIVNISFGGSWQLHCYIQANGTPIDSNAKRLKGKHSGPFHWHWPQERGRVGRLEAMAMGDSPSSDIPRGWAHLVEECSSSQSDMQAALTDSDQTTTRIWWASRLKEISRRLGYDEPTKKTIDLVSCCTGSFAEAAVLKAIWLEGSWCLFKGGLGHWLCP